MREVKINNLTLINADCREIISSGEHIAELAVCDPDYALKNKLLGGQWAARYKHFANNMGGLPDKLWFENLKRITDNQVIWGANYFDFLPPTRCFLIWDKKDKLPKMADCEYAWTSFDKNAKVFCSARNPHGISGNDKRIHMCQKPVQLYMWIYNMLSKSTDKILDTHMGSGSSAIAAYETGQNYIGIEINPEFFDAAVARVEKHISTHPKINI